MKNRGFIVMMSHPQAFAASGVYEYMCGLHPNMKGAVEVK